MPVTANSIITPQAPKAATCLCTTANANYTATPTNTQTLITAGPNGARVTRITAIPLETLGGDVQLQLFRDGDGTGTTKRFFKSAKMTNYTMAQTTEAPTTDFGLSDANPLILAAGEKVFAAVGVSKNVALSAEWADY